MTVPDWADPARVAGRAAAPIAEQWKRLATWSPQPPAVTEGPIEALPEPARRWLRHATEPDSAAPSVALLEMTGWIKVGRWLPFTAVQVLTREAYLWVARAGRLVSVSGFDRFTDGEGEMRWSLAGRLPLLRAGGRDVTRSSAARLAIESTIWLPTASGTVRWRAGDDPDVAIATRYVAGEEHAVELRVDADGRPRSVTMQRWGNPKGKTFGFHPFGGLLDGEATFAGFTIPDRVRVGYWPGEQRWTTGEFFRSRITRAAFR